MRTLDKKINLNNKGIKSIHAVGDIHGEFGYFSTEVADILKDAAVIVCGDVGLGFYDRSATIRIFDIMEKTLAASNVYAIFFRGNHDDPLWYEYIDDEFAKNYPHIYIAEDFTIVELEDYKTLLWGGAVSVDRKYRTLGTSYWKAENAKELPMSFAETLDINCVCTHTAPSFCLPVISKNIEYFIRQDFLLEDELKAERELIDRGAYRLYNANKDTLRTWVYGHFHDTFNNSNQMNEEISKFEHVSFIGLDMMRYTDDYMTDFNKKNHYLYNRKTKNNIIPLVYFD